MIEIPINNNRKLILIQSAEGIEIVTTSKEGIESKRKISEGDMVMLLNYYGYVKDNDVNCEFVNPNPKVKKNPLLSVNTISLIDGKTKI